MNNKIILAILIVFFAAVMIILNMPNDKAVSGYVPVATETRPD